MIPHRWVDPEFKKEKKMKTKKKEDTSREVEAGTATGEEVAAELEDKREVVNNLREEGEDIVLDFEMEEVQPLKAKK